MNRVAFLIVLMMTLSGCSLFSTRQEFPLEETSPHVVKNCRPVGQYIGPHGYKYWGPPPAAGPFKLQTAEKAKAAGATHIYWRSTGMGMGGNLTGFAFDCTGVDLSPDTEESEE